MRYKPKNIAALRVAFQEPSGSVPRAQPSGISSFASAARRKLTSWHSPPTRSPDQLIITPAVATGMLVVAAGSWSSKPRSCRKKHSPIALNSRSRRLTSDLGIIRS
jgi:hypothetical protein